MKKIFATIILLYSLHVSAQVKPIETPVKKTVVMSSKESVKMTTLTPAKKPPTSPPQAPNTDIQTASVSFITGDDGKDHDTRMLVALWDNNKRAAAANFTTTNGHYIIYGNNAEYFTGSTVTVPLTIETSIATGKIIQVGAVPLPVLRLATPADFNSGGELRIDIAPKGHDTWKMRSVTLHLTFNNDSNSPHTITWDNITLSQNSETADLLFDKNFNAVQ